MKNDTRKTETTTAGPTWRKETGLMMELPSREEMLDALRGGVSACLFQATTLTEAHTTVVRDMGGLDEQAPFVELACRYAGILARMYEGLSPEEDKESEQAAEGRR